MATLTRNSTHPGSNRPGTPNRGWGDGNDTRNIEPTLNTSSIRFTDPIPLTLYSDIAEETARSIAGGSQREVNKSSQLRRFYDELVMLQGKVGNSEERFAAQAPYIQMMKAKVAYAQGRNKVDANFDHLLRHVIDQARDCTSLARAKLFMEAFMAFYKIHGPRD